MLSSFVSKTVGRFLLPNLERDLTRAVGDGLRSSSQLTDCFLAPVVYGFEKRQQQPDHACGYGYGLGRATSALERRIATATVPEPTFEKVHYRVPPGGLFR